MFLPGSRYERARRFSSAPDGRDMVRPRDIMAPPEAVEHTVAAGDRADLLAHHYYGDARLWWRILDANPHLVCASDLEDSRLFGHIIVIPRSRG